MSLAVIPSRWLQVLSLAVLLTVLLACTSKSNQELVDSAKNYLAKGDNSAAIIQLKNALQGNPDIPEARFLLAKALFDTEDLIAAEIEFRKARDLGYSNNQIILFIAKSLLLREETKKLINEFAVLEIEDPLAKAELKTLLATAYLQENNAKQAEVSIEAAMKAVPNYVPALIQKARLIASKGEIDLAFALVTDILHKSPNESNALLLKGDLLKHGRGDQDAALTAYRSAVDASKVNYAARGAVIASLLARKDLAAAKPEIDSLRKLRPTHPQTKYFEAQLAFQAADYKAANDQVAQLLKVVPDSPQVLALAGVLAYQRGALLQAEQHLTKSLAVMPDQPGTRLLLGETYLRSGRTAKTLEALRPMVETREPTARALALTGAAYLQSGETQKAQEYFARAVKLDPSDTKSKVALATARLATSDKALSELESISASDSSTYADMAIINAHLTRKNFDAALKAIDRLEIKLPNRPFPHYIRGRTLLMKDNPQLARASFEKALAFDIKYFPAVELLTELDFRQNKSIDAKNRLDALLKADANDAQVLMAAAKLQAQIQGPKGEVVSLLRKAISVIPDDVAPRIMLVNYLLVSRDFKEALNVAQVAISALPGNSEILGALGRAQAATGDTNQAVASFRKAVALLPNSPLPLIALADSLIANNDIAGAEDNLNRALRIAPENVLAQQKLFGVQLAGRRFNEAIVMARTVQKQRPTQSIGHSMEGDVEFVRQNWPAAVTAYRNAIKSEATSDVAQRLHFALLAAGKSAEADAMSTEWMSAHPRDAGFTFHLGTVAIQKSDYEAAERHFMQVAELQPQNAHALNNLAWTRFKLKKPGSQVIAEKALLLSPEEPAFLDTLASILSEHDNLVKALQLQRRAVTLRPQQFSYRLRLAEMLIKAGEKSAAREQLELLSAAGEKSADQQHVQRLRSQL